MLSIGHTRSAALVLLSITIASAGCARRAATPDEHAGHDGDRSRPVAQMTFSPRTGAVTMTPIAQTAIPPGAAEAQARLAASPRHGEWVTVASGTTATGVPDSVRAWAVYPERRDRAPVVIVIHENVGLSHWVRSVADQLAADGFIAIAPDLLSGLNVPNGPDGAPNPDSVRAVIRNVRPADAHRRILALAQYGMKLPAARQRYGIVGFCWGGSTSFMHAVSSPSLGASVVYYGGSPPTDSLAKVRAPVLGLYGGDDARVNSTVPPADSAMKRLNKPFEHRMFAGAGHGFLRQQDGREGANLAASREAWPMTVAFFKRHLER